MVDEQQPAKRVVKRVVKKAVVRPETPAPEAPKLRYGRPVATTTKPPVTVATKSSAKTTVPAAKAAPRPKVTRTLPKVEVGATLGSAGRRLGTTSRTAARGVRHGARTAGGFAGRQARTVAAWRLPHLNLYLASVITGAVVGLVSVGLGALALSVFSSVRGVASGGGFWGGIVFVGVAVIAYVLGAVLLQGFGSRSARLTSVLGVVITIVAMLGLFLDLVDSAAALVVLPLLGLASFALSHWLIDLAENAPAVVE